MMRKEKTMNNNREIRVMIFEPGKAPYTAVLEDSLEHRKALVGGEIECISLPHETVLCCNAGGKWMGLPANRQFGNDTLHGTFFLYGDTPEGRGVSLTEEQIACFWITLLSHVLLLWPLRCGQQKIRRNFCG